MLFKKYIFFEEENENLKISLKNGFDIDNMGKLLNVKDDWQPQGNNQDRLYFFPGCTVPRFKVRENYSCTIKPENATAAFVSATEIKEGSAVVVHKNVSYLGKTDAVHFIESNFGIQEKERVRFNMLYDQVESEVFLTDDVRRMFHQTFYNTAYPMNDCVEPSWWELKHRRQSFFQVTPDSGILNLKCPIYWETSVLKYLNENQVVIDAKRYDEIRAFGLSEDKENHVLLMELMANSDFEKSFVHLLFLLKEFGNKFALLKEAHHVNFKSLITYMDLNLKNLDVINLQDLTRALKKHKKFTRSNVQRITSLCAGDTYLGDDAAITQMYAPGQVLRSDLDHLLDN